MHGAGSEMIRSLFLEFLLMIEWSRVPGVSTSEGFKSVLVSGFTYCLRFTVWLKFIDVVCQY